MLEVRNITMQFGGLYALKDVSMTVRNGEIRGLIGPNGSGKTTMLNVMTGFYVPTSGEISLEGQKLSGKATNVIARCGVARTFQNIALFSEMSALENVVTAACVQQKVSLFQAAIHTKKMKEQEKLSYEKAYELLDFVGLKGKEHFKSRNLPYGQQRLLEVARALATDPKVLLLDEPVAGMNEKESAEAARLVHKMQNRGLTIILIEHHMKFVMDLCDTVTVLNSGEKIAEGTPSEVQNDETVIECYLGKKRERKEEGQDAPN